MTLAILLLVSFLALMQVLGMIGFSNTRARNEAAKRIARELYELQHEDDWMHDSSKPLPTEPV